MMLPKEIHNWIIDYNLYLFVGVIWHWSILHRNLNGHRLKMKLFSFYNVIWAICTALFLVQMTFIYIDYHQGKTGVGRSYEDETEMQLPCLTFCPLPAFRSNNFSVVALKTNLDVFKNLTYGQQDIFFNSSRKHSIVTKLLKRQPN